MRYLLLVLGIILSLILTNITSAFSQEPVVTEITPTENQTEPETQWLWGEVVSIDTQNNELSVKYLDYEDDQEKELTISVDDKTVYENVKGLSEIMPKDTISIDYVVSPDGKNIAKNITIEKEEATPVAEPEATEETPSTNSTVTTETTPE